MRIIFITGQYFRVSIDSVPPVTGGSQVLDVLDSPHVDKDKYLLRFLGIRLRRLVAIVVAAAVVAAAGIGIGLFSFMKPQQPNDQIPASDVPAADNDVGAGIENVANATQQEMVYNEFLKAGWPEESTKVFSSVQTEYRETNSTYTHYTQILPSGMISDVKISISPGEKYVPVEADKILTQFGSVMYLKDAKYFSSDDIFVTKTSYFIPYDSLDPELVNELGWGDPISQASTLQLPWMQYVSATTETTGVGLESTNTLIRSSDPSPGAADMDARLADAEADLVRWERESQIENIAQEGREFVNEAPNDPVVQEVNRRLTPEAVELRRQQAAFHDAETRQMVDEIRTRHELTENTLINKKWLVRFTAVAGTGLFAYEMYEIDQQHDSRSLWLSYYEDCVRNPDIPRYGGDDDPGYVQALEQLEAARNDLRVNTAAMYGSSVINTVAGLAAHNPAVDAMTMLASSANNARLDRTAQNDIMAPLSQLGTPCRAQSPCEDPEQEPTPTPTPYGDHTPGPDEPGFYYTIGPRESYEPPERRQVQCKPPEPNQLTVRISEIVEADQGTPRRVTFEATANVTDLVTYGNLIVQMPYFTGNATGYYHETIRYQDDTLEGGWCNVEIQGVATMTVGIQRNMSGFNMQLAEVSVGIIGDLPISQNPAGCYILNNEAPTTTDGHIYGCNFYDVDERGGTYHNGTGPDNDRLGASPWYYDDCELVMGPLVPSYS